MKDSKERLQKDIAEAFDFVRYLVKNPKALRRIKNGSEIRIIARPCAETRSRRTKNVQTFAAETVFHPL